jgi:hypothetical protein
MDDYNIVSLQESTNEWVTRLVNIIRPCVIDGIKAILNEANTICVENNEEEKYLMTFQNFLSRIPKWNEEILEKEVERIHEASACRYLEDLITCVHIIQLKALTCVRVGQKQKAIDIDVPKLSNFIHKVYIQVARKLYGNIYLFEINIPPLQVQKNNREIELITNDCILEAVRESIPVDAILKAYLDETIEENVETVMTESTIKKEQEKEQEKEKEKEHLAIVPVVTKNTTSDTSYSSSSTDASVTKPKEDISVTEIKTEESIVAAVNKPEEKMNISFSHIDQHKSDNKEVENVTAPKDIPTLENISEVNNEKRKLEELAMDDDDEEKITIHNNGNDDNITLDIQTL